MRGDTWIPVFERDYTAIGGKAYYALDYEVKVGRNWSANLTNPNSKGNVEWTDVEFKWMENVGSTGDDADFVQKGRSFQVTAYATNDEFGTSGFYQFSVGISGYTTALENKGTWQNVRRGTFVQKFSTMESGDYTFRLEGRVAPHKSRNDFYAINPERTKIVYGSDALVKVKNFNVFEALVSDS
jgi:hypothetical protein